VATKARPKSFDLWAVASKADLSDASLRELALEHFPQ
jgi:hypothetical protein